MNFARVTLKFALRTPSCYLGAECEIGKSATILSAFSNYQTLDLTTMPPFVTAHTFCVSQAGFEFLWGQYPGVCLQLDWLGEKCHDVTDESPGERVLVLCHSMKSRNFSPSRVTRKGSRVLGWFAKMAKAIGCKKMIRVTAIFRKKM